MSDQTREQPGERDYHGRFIKGSAAAREAGIKGGLITPGQFKSGAPRTLSTISWKTKAVCNARRCR
jgi:hypothetical protein